jgi:cell division septation protein DedD
MTFYKAVEQKDANAQLTPATEAVATSAVSTPAAPSPGTSTTNASPTASQTQPSQTASTPESMPPLTTSGYFVQVAAVSKEDDAEALVDALKKKQYPAFVATNASTDKLFRIQLGPYGDIKDAEAMRSRLVNDGYNPILKK